MEYFKLMNRMLDEGWKMSNFTCKKCKSNALIDDSKTTFYCCRCDDEIYLDDHQEFDIIHEETQE